MHAPAHTDVLACAFLRAPPPSPPPPSLPQVKSKTKELQLHRDSPLGDTVLECYASGSRNVFVLGFVPVKSENTVVLLARDTPPNHPTIRDLALDLSQWQVGVCAGGGGGMGREGWGRLAMCHRVCECVWAEGGGLY